MEPLNPRITKSTAVPAIISRFPSTENLLLRFELAKAQANLWDGERDGLREAVKTIPEGQYGQTILSWTSTAPVMYPNSSGKHQLENTLQSTLPIAEPGPVTAYAVDFSPEEFLDAVLHELQKSKADALTYLQTRWLGTGTAIPNNSLYEKKGAEKSKIAVIPS